MAEIIPAILPQNFDELRVSLVAVPLLSSYFQIDICDGVFVPTVTWPYGDSREFLAIIGGEEGLPFWKDIQFEIDLMVTNPEDVIDDWIDVGASRIIVHNKSTDALAIILERLEYAQIERGVALQIDEDPEG